MNKIELEFKFYICCANFIKIGPYIKKNHPPPPPRKGVDPLKHEFNLGSYMS